MFLDVETTGLDGLDRVVSLGVISDALEFYDLVYEGKKISAKASSINNITNEMLKDKPKLQESKSYKFLSQNNNSSLILVAHNSKFVLEMLERSGFIYDGKVIDTLRVAKHLIPECESYALNFLRYELKLYKKEDLLLIPHNALSDAKIVKNLFDYLLEMVTIEEMLELSYKNVLLQKIGFGKYKGSYIEEICYNDRAYLEWLLNAMQDLDEDLRYSIEYYLKGSSF